MTDPGYYNEQAGYPGEPRHTAPGEVTEPPTTGQQWAQHDWSQGAQPTAPADTVTIPGGGNPGPLAASTAKVEGRSAERDSLFGHDDLGELRSRWAGVQAAFVDDPKGCVQRADGLVSDVVEQLTNGFAHARSRLEEQWARGEQASTEDLRVALMQYREFFERLLSV